MRGSNWVLACGTISKYLQLFIMILFPEPVLIW